MIGTILARFRRDARANIVVLAALALAVSVGVGAIAVDSAVLYQERRAVQTAVDLAALAAVSNPANAETIVIESLIAARAVPAGSTAASLRSGRDGVRLTLEVGRYSSDPALAPNARFSVGATPFDAVRVGLERPGHQFFARGWSPPPAIGASATATREVRAAFSIGSRLARLDGGVVNDVLGRLLGAGVSLDLVDYRALVGARVGLFSFLDALATEMGVRVGTYSDLLAMNAERGTIARALSRAGNATDPAVARILTNLGRTTGRIGLSKLIDLGRLGNAPIGQSPSHLTAQLSVFDVLSATAGLADGVKQAGVGTSLGIPGVSQVTIDVRVGEPPQGGSWFVVGPTGSVARTAQIRARASLTVLGSAILLNAGIRLPIALEVASGAAQLAAVTCPTSANPHGTVRLNARSGILRAFIGEVGNDALAAFDTPLAPARATLINLLLLRVTGSASLSFEQQAPVAVDFSSADIANGVVKPVRSSGLVGSLLTSLLSERSFTITPELLGLGLGSPTLIRDTLRATLLPLALPLDAVLERVLDTLGLGLGEADLRVYGVECGAPILVG